MSQTHEAKDRARAIEANCKEILRSPYVFKDLPAELHRLRTLMRSVEVLTREEVPYLVAEVKQLRAENKRLNSSLDASRETPVQ